MKEKNIYEKKIIHHEARAAYDEEVNEIIGKVYVADDGTEFNTEYECQNYEKRFLEIKADAIRNDKKVKDLDFEYEGVNYIEALRLTNDEINILKKAFHYIRDWTSKKTDNEEHLYTLGTYDDDYLLEDYDDIFSKAKTVYEQLKLENE